MQVVSFIQAHWQELVDALMAIVLSARFIVKLTPTPADDTFLDKVVEFLKHVGLSTPHKD